MKAILCQLFLVALAAALLASCNTVRGAGRDIQNFGSAVSNIGH